MLNMKIIDIEVDAGLLSASIAASMLRCSSALMQYLGAMSVINTGVVFSSQLDKITSLLNHHL
jgi:hypothetical protein